MENSKIPLLYFNIFSAINRSTEPKGPLQYFDEALTIDPSSFNALNKATTLDHLQRYDEALQFYDKALSIDPSSMKD